MGERLVVLTAGDTAFVFDEGDERIDVQTTVCIGANLDVEVFKLTPARWDEVRPQLGSDVEIVDCRTDPGAPS